MELFLQVDNKVFNVPQISAVTIGFSTVTVLTGGRELTISTKDYSEILKPAMDKFSIQPVEKPVEAQVEEVKETVEKKSRKKAE